MAPPFLLKLEAPPTQNTNDAKIMVAPSEPSTGNGDDHSLHPGGNGEVDGIGEARIKVFIVEDHDLFRTQLGRLVQKDPSFILCGETDNAKDAVERIEAIQPDLVIVDITLKGMNGLDLIRELKLRIPNTIALVLSMHNEAMYAERALRAGASGYLSKHQASYELKSAMDHVLKGGIYLSAHMTTELLEKHLTDEPE